jgi:hypothetical protein
LRFAVHGPGYPVASPRSHGVPRRDVSSRVYISIADEAAGSAQEEGLALARLPVHLPARRATLAGERRSDPFHPIRGFFLQAAHQQAPAGSQDATVQCCLGCHVPARSPSSSSSRARHVPYPQVLDADHVKPARKVRAGLLGPVSPAVSFATLESGDGKLYPPTAIRPAPCAGELPTQAHHAAALPAGQPRSGHHLAGRQGRRYDNAPVNSYHFAVTGSGDRLWDGSEGNVPAARTVACHAIGFHARGYSTGPAESYPSHFRDAHLTDIARQAAYVSRFEGYHPESLVPPGLPSCGAVMSPTEVISHGLGMVAECLLLNHLASRAQPSVFRTYLGKLPALLQVARRGLAAWTPVRSLLDRQVPHEPGMRAMVPQNASWAGEGSRRYRDIRTH